MSTPCKEAKGVFEVVFIMLSYYCLPTVSIIAQMSSWQLMWIICASLLSFQLSLPTKQIN